MGVVKDIIVSRNIAKFQSCISFDKKDFNKLKYNCKDGTFHDVRNKKEHHILLKNCPSGYRKNDYIDNLNAWTILKSLGISFDLKDLEGIEIKAFFDNTFKLRYPMKSLKKVEPETIKELLDFAERESLYSSYSKNRLTINFDLFKYFIRYKQLTGDYPDKCLIEMLDGCHLKLKNDNEIVTFFDNVKGFLTETNYYGTHRKAIIPNLSKWLKEGDNKSSLFNPYWIKQPSYRLMLEVFLSRSKNIMFDDFRMKSKEKVLIVKALNELISLLYGTKIVKIPDDKVYQIIGCLDSDNEEKSIVSFDAEYISSIYRLIDNVKLVNQYYDEINEHLEIKEEDAITILLGLNSCGINNINKFIKFLTKSASFKSLNDAMYNYQMNILYDKISYEHRLFLNEIKEKYSEFDMNTISIFIDLFNKVDSKTFGKILEMLKIELSTGLYISDFELSRLVKSVDYLKDVFNLRFLKSSDFKFLLEYNFRRNFGPIKKYYVKYNMKLNAEEIKTISEVEYVSHNDNFYELVSNKKAHVRSIKYKEYNHLVKTLNFMPINDEIVSKYLNHIGNIGFMDYLKKPSSINKHSDEYKYFVGSDLFKFILNLPERPNPKKVKIISMFLKSKATNTFLEEMKQHLTGEIDLKLLSQNRIDYIQDKLNVDDAFINTYIDNILEFCISENYDIFKSYQSNKNADMNSKNNLKLIAIALLMGKYTDIKFNYEDLIQETGFDISKESYNMWKKTDRYTAYGMTFEDASDFNTIMSIGEKPTATCMNFVNGAYSHCLISNFDTCKKILKIYKDDKYIGRAILRLTISSDKKIFTERERKLEFKNFAEENIVKEDNGAKKELVLFVERLYTKEQDKLNKMVRGLTEFLLPKAEKMGAKLIVSDGRYAQDLFYDEESWIQINRSKNGSQYMDSLGGSNYQVDELTSQIRTFSVAKSKER